MNFTINCNKISNINQFHTEAKKVFNFPDYYGNNLDALADVLRDITDDLDKNTPITINFNNFSSLINVIQPDLLAKIMSVFSCWKSEYPTVKIRIIFEL